MAGKWGNLRLAAACIALALLCVLGYYVLLYLVSPHPTGPPAPIPSDLPPGARAYPGGYVVTFNTLPPNATVYPDGVIVMPGEDANLTPEQRAAMANDSGSEREVSFWELPLWIQLYALPAMVLGAIASLFGAAFVVRRVRKSQNRNKRDVYTYVAENPGCTAPELARGENMNIGTVRYHIQRLQDEGRIVLQKIGKYSRIFVNSHTYDDREKLIASYLHNDSSRSILGMIMECPGISNQMLSEKLGMEKSLVYRYMQKLLDDRIVMFEWEGKNKLYYIDMAAKPALIKLMPRNYQCPGLMKEEAHE